MMKPLKSVEASSDSIAAISSDVLQSARNNPGKSALVAALVLVILTLYLYNFTAFFYRLQFLSPEYAMQVPFVRLLVVLLATGAGFFAGWFFTNQAKPFRRIVFLCAAGIGLTLALIGAGPTGYFAVLIMSTLGFFAAFGYWAVTGIKSLGTVPTTFGSSRWANQDDIWNQGLIGEGGIALGAFGRDATPIFYPGDRHLLTVAPTRSGKGTTQIIPNLLTYEGSMLVIDPKGENALITAKRRKEMGQDVHIVDPWGIVQIDEIESSTFNPLDWLDVTDIDITENAMILADALVVGENHADNFWNEEAKALLQGILLHVASSTKEDGRRHLGRVRDLLVGGSDVQRAFFEQMAQSDHHIISSTGHRCLQKDEKLLSNVLAAVQAQTHFLDSARLRENLRSSSFRFDEMKQRPMTVYLVLPADRLDTFGRWLRLLVQQAITVNARNIASKPEKPILFILDEFAALGRLSMVEQAFGLMAGFGMQLWAIVQDLSQLERVYGDGWQSFIANAGMVNYFGSSDQKTADYFSALCGETTVWNFSSAISRAVSSTSGKDGGSSTSGDTSSDTLAAAQRKLIYPDELMRLPAGKQLILIENLHPLNARKVPWFEDPDLRHLGVNLQNDTSGDVVPSDGGPVLEMGTDNE